MNKCWMIGVLFELRINALHLDRTKKGVAAEQRETEYWEWNKFSGAIAISAIFEFDLMLVLIMDEHWARGWEFALDRCQLHYHGGQWVRTLPMPLFELAFYLNAILVQHNCVAASSSVHVVASSPAHDVDHMLQIDL